MKDCISSLYLSRLFLNPRSRRVMSELAQPYEMHRTLMRAFPQATDGELRKARDEFGVLFRAEADPRYGVKVYVQSRVEPDWGFLDDLDDYLDKVSRTPGYSCKNIFPAYRNIRDDQSLTFRLRANPTKRVWKQDEPMKGKRVKLFREEEQIAWLTRKGRERAKGESGGFDLLMKKVRDGNGEERHVPRVTVCREGKQKGFKRGEDSGHVTTHLAVLYEGLLRVTDVNDFIDTIVNGIGPAKAFGFGLLSVAPVRGSDEL